MILPGMTNKHARLRLVPAGSPETCSELSRYAGMNVKVSELLKEVERLLVHVEHNVPPEVEVVEKVKKLIRELRNEGHAAEAGLAPHGHEGRNQGEEGNPAKK
jgi:hypothetical protein